MTASAVTRWNIDFELLGRTLAVELATILKLAPFAANALKRYRRSNPANSLDRLVKAEFERDPTLGPGVTEALITQWFYLHNDPRGAVIIAGLLENGDVVWLEALQIRTQELLDGLEILPWDVPRTVERLVAAVRNNFVAAQKDAETATQRGTSAILSAVDPLATTEQVETLGSQIERLQRSLEPPAPRVLLLPSSFDEDQQRHLNWLNEHDGAAAARLGQIVASSGVDGLVGLVRKPPTWTADQPGLFWRAVGLILTDAGRMREAERAFAQEAASVDAADRAEALMDAARRAEADGRPLDADGHLDEARSLSPEHPSVVLFLVSRVGDPASQLEQLEMITPSTDAQLARKEVQRAIALLGLQRFAEADAAAQASIEANPHGGGREIATLGTIMRAQSRLPKRDHDDRPLMDAVQYQLRLHTKAIAHGRGSAAGIAGARAALGTAVLGDQQAAVELVVRVAAIEDALRLPEVRSVLVEASLTAGDAGLAKRLLGELDNSVESRLQHATIMVLAGEDVSAAAERLDALLDELEPGPARTNAVVMRLLAASDPNIDFDPSMAQSVDDGERLVAQTRASRATATGDFAAARAAVVGYDDAVTLSLRVDIAEADNTLQEAVGLQAALTHKERSAANLLRLAGLRARAGDFPGAIGDAMRLATDDRKLPLAREAAYRIAARAAIDAQDFGELEDISDRWKELSGDTREALWTYTFALARQNRHPEALEFALSSGLRPETHGDRHVLFAELYAYGLSDGDTRMRALMELSDQFDRPIELERAFIGSVLNTPPTERGDDPEIVARFQEAISTFEARFPEAGGLVAIQIDPEDDGAAILEKLAAVGSRGAPEDADARQDAIDGVRQGRIPIAFLAALVGRSTTDTIIRNGAYPLGVFDADSHEADLDGANDALDRASAAWDETACITVASLRSDHVQRIRAAVPDSFLGQAVHDSLDYAVRAQPAGEQVAVMQILPDGTPRLIEEDPDTVARIRAVQASAAKLSSGLRVIPDQAVGDDNLATWFRRRERQRVQGPLDAVISALLAARETQLPLYSDDRVVRAYAREFGLKSYGTLALIDAMERRGLLTAAETLSLLDATIDLGVWGLSLRPAEYIDVARRAKFDLSRCLRPLLADEALLRADSRLLHNAMLLGTIAVERPDVLDAWASAIVDSYRLLLGLSPEIAASLLIAGQLDPSPDADVSKDRIQRNMSVIYAFRNVGTVKDASGETDPLISGAARWLHATSEPAQRAAILARLKRQVDDAAAAALSEAFEGNGESDD